MTDNTQPIPASHENGQAERLARLFHDTYERLAPKFGYETREETKQFDPESPNGKLMIAVCGEFLDWHNKQVKNAVATAEDDLDQYWNKELDKQIEVVLDRLDRSLNWQHTTPRDVIAEIEAERKRLKESK